MILWKDGMINKIISPEIKTNGTLCSNGSA